MSEGLESLARWADRQPFVVGAEERGILIGLVYELGRYAQAVEVLECKVRGLEAAVRLLIRGEPIDAAWHDRLQRECEGRTVHTEGRAP